MADEVLFAREKHIGLVTLNRTEALNALTLPMILALTEQLEAWEQDDDIHAVVVCAQAGKAFCAGGDVRWLYEAGKREDPSLLQFFWHEYRLNHLIHQFKKPYIALMNGMTMGGGVGISLHGAYPVASENFSFAMPETAIGFFPDIGASYLLSRCRDQVGVYLGLTGARLNAADALSLNLVRFFVSADKFDCVIVALIEADLSTQADLCVEACLKRHARPPQTAPIQAVESLIHQSFAALEVELILADLNQAGQDWHQKTLKTLAQKSPLSLKVTLEQLKKAAHLTFSACLEMDYCLVQHFMRDPDFYEGVRALLVDKDKSPKWRPETLEQVTEQRVASYFEPLGSALCFG